MYKRGVVDALDALRAALIDIGANPHRIDLPRPPGVMKVGVDDFIVSYGKKARQAFNSLPHIPLFLGEGITGTSLLVKTYEAPKYVVPGLIAVGLTILAGKPKIGKSWLALSIVIAVALGQRVLDYADTDPAKVLYLALEDSEARLQDRLKKIAPNLTEADNAHFYCEWNRVEEGGLLALERWLMQHPECRLVMIDTLAKVRRIPKNNNSYYEDYAAVSALKEIADKFKIAIVVVHHVRKQESSDAFDLISGTNGITGSADTNIVLVRDRNSVDGVLHITGRDVIEQELALSYTDCVWKILGKAGPIYASRAEQEIVLAIVEAGMPLGPTQLANATGRKTGSLPKILNRMVRDGVLEKQEGGKYVAKSKKPEKFKSQEGE